MIAPATSSDSETTRTHWFARWAGPLAILLLLVGALFVLHDELSRYRYRDITHALFALHHRPLLTALALTCIAYALLPGYDALALSYAGTRLPFHRVAFSSLISYGLSQTLGFPFVTGGSVRYRFWSAWGLSSTDIAKAVSFIGVTFVLGMIGMAGATLVAEPRSSIALVRFPLDASRALGLTLLLIVALYLAWSATKRAPIEFRGWSFPVPALQLSAAQLGLAAIDWITAAGVLYVLLPSSAAIQFLPFLGAFLLAQFAGQISHVPGGLGVFESLMLLFLKTDAAPTQILASLVAFRAIYYLIPFVLALAMLAGHELVRQRKLVAAIAANTGVLAARWGPAILPQALSATTFIGGVILLVSGATPSVRGRVSILEGILPLGIIELSHFLGSLCGVGLLVLAWAIRRRLDAAYSITVGLLVVGIAASLFKGLDWEEALALSVVLSVVVPSRGAFYRKAALTSEPISPAWIVAVAVVVGVTTSLGLFSYKHVQYSDELWWQFTAGGDAPRFLRATVGILAALGAFALMRLLRHAEAVIELPTTENLQRAKAIVDRSTSANANIVLVGDKSLLFSRSGNAFLMYGVEGRSWVALGDPIGPTQDAAELVWQFREEADRHGAWTVFYEVGVDRLPLYIDLGLTLLKIGEQATIPLSTFSLDGGPRRGLRRTMREMARNEVEFEIIPSDEVPRLFPQLREVSDAWLAAKHTREKSFSLGRFDPKYLSFFPVAIARRDDRVLAFANVWTSGDLTETSVDLMRYRADAPAGVMEFLFIKLLLWAKENGYDRFNLGMAPLAGLESRALAPVWNRLGATLYRQGEAFYNFRGLRAFKDKFDPVWEPRYLASPGGLALPRILTNTAALISGGLKGVVAR